MAQYQYDFKKIAAVVAVVVVAIFIYKSYISESFTVRGADIKAAYTPPTASTMNAPVPIFTDGNRIPSPASDGDQIPYTDLESSVMQTPSGAKAS